MRVFDRGLQLNVRPLGACPGFAELKAQLEQGFDLSSPDTMTDEEVFFGTHRVVASNPNAPPSQKHAVAPRSDLLGEIVQPQIKFLQGIYPGTVPVLVQCATLPPGAQLLWHIDSYLYQSVSHKVHFAISTNLDAKYECKDRMRVRRSYHFQEGYVYEINNILTHRALNLGETPRTHVIIDMMSEDQLNRFKDDGVDFFFTYHNENKTRERNEA